jgi:hypothetical protein
MASQPILRVKCTNTGCKRHGLWQLVTLDRVGFVLLMSPRYVCVCCLWDMQADSRLLDAYAKVQREIVAAGETDGYGA